MAANYQKAAEEKLTNALRDVFDALNVLGRKNDEVVKDFFSRQHRTLQQQFVGVVVVPVLEQLAEADRGGFTDLRNQASARLASKLLRDVNENDLYLPLV